MESMTRENVEAAFAGECQAHLKYLAFAEQAEKEDYPNVARLFRAIAASQKRHALYHLRLLGEIGSTEENLREAHERDDREIAEMCPTCSERGNPGDENDVRGECIALEAEKSHLPLYDEAKSAVDADEDIEDSPIYVCGGCGRTVRNEAPERCPICDTPRDEFDIY
ncbi:MAG: rubrerythrin family protein [Armatimonadota bacterium]